MTCFSSLISSNSLVALYPFPFIPTYAFFPSILNFSTLPQAYQDYPCLFAFIPIVPSAWNALSSWLNLIFPFIISQRVIQWRLLNSPRQSFSQSILPQHLHCHTWKGRYCLVVQRVLSFTSPAVRSCLPVPLIKVGWVANWGKKSE